MATLDTSHPRFWIHESRMAMPSEPVSLRHDVECVAELQQSRHDNNNNNTTVAPPMATIAPECRARDAGDDLPPARKLQKAGRERLRRDQLNEQFAKLADVLDPIRPRNDKGSILAESILAVNELRADIARMKSENVALSDESRDLSAEKAELQEEKTLLETQTGQLQEQVNQSGDNNNNNNQSGFQLQFPYSMMMKGSKEDAGPPPFFAVAPFMHPAYQTFGMLGPRQHIHVERPAARYPVPIHPTPLYPSKILKASDPPTDLQLQIPGLQSPSSNTQHSQENTADDARSRGDEQLASELSLSTNSTLQ